MEVISQNLEQEAGYMASNSLNALFEADPSRGYRYAIDMAHLYINFSKHWIRDETRSLLLEWADNQQLSQSIQALRQGDQLNVTEKEAALHVALRDWENPTPLWLAGRNVRADILSAYEKMADWVARLHRGAYSSIIHIGIGGSDLGPRLAVEALSAYRHPLAPIIHFVSGVDDVELQKAFNASQPKETLIVIATKSFSTTETLLNAHAAKAWLMKHGCTPSDHLLAITARADRAEAFGIKPDYILPIGSWIGGRYSLWSCMGFALAAFIGMESFQALLTGAKAVDDHFFEKPLAFNAPVWMGLLSAWYRNFFHIKMQVILPYHHQLAQLPSYLQQLEMESCGKSSGLQGQRLLQSGMAVWGQVGSLAQHAFNQWLHQGTETVLTDFILIAKTTDTKTHQQHLTASALAQSQALMNGQPSVDMHLHIPGNRPSTTILLPQLSPSTFGSLLALYEHKVFTQSMVWQLNPFDQYGVELGKQLTHQLLPYLEDNASLDSLDSATKAIIEKIRTLS